MGSKSKKKESKCCEKLSEIINNTSDLLNEYGFGIVAYFDLLFKLFLIFCVISLFAIALMIFYKSEGQIESYLNEGFKPSLVKLSMINLGISETECYSQ